MTLPSSRLVCGAILVAVSFLNASCSFLDTAREPDNDPAVITTGPHCNNVDSRHECLAATVVTAESDFPDALRLWGYADKEVEFTGNTLVLAGYSESSTCPAQVDSVALENSKLDVTISLVRADSCTTDEAPRSFIIETTSQETSMAAFL